ncbi:MAG: PAS domain S-box protein [Syntrophales bacterium]|nr:PAS domain S-box protein [Syntrophales bacterium]
MKDEEKAKEQLIEEQKAMHLQSATLENGASPCITQVKEDLQQQAHKAIETALLEAEEKYRNIVENAQEGIFRSTPQGTFLMVNPSFARRAGYDSPEEMIAEGKEIQMLYVNPEDRIQIRHLLETEGIVTGFEAEFQRRDGEKIWVSINVRAVKDGTGKIMYFEGTTENITERKQWEKALQESRENFRRSLDESPLGVRIVSEEGETLYANRVILDIFGYIDMEEWRTNPAVNRYTERSYAEFKARREKRRLGRDDFPEYEIEIVRKDGALRHLQVWRKSIFWNGKSHYQVIYRDITQSKLAEEEKAKLQNQLLQSQKIESIGRLAGGVAHDFNNMLGVILGHVEMALEQVDPAQPLHANLQEIRKAAERSADLTRRLLAFARKQTIAPKVIDINKTVKGMLEMLRRLIGEDIHLIWLPAGNLWPIKVDPSQIDQLLANLCVNARDAIAGVGKVTIETGNVSFDEAYCDDHIGFVPGDYVLLAVSDNGCGMDKEVQSNLFEPFFTTKAVGEGTGLGLAMVYGIVKQNSGFINVYSEPHQGTTFRIYLPRHIGKAEQVRTEGPQETVMRGHETVLVVEDEPAILDLSRLMLEKQGYRVLTAGAPGEAIRLAGEHAGEIHLLMTDVVMPEMNGRDLAKKLLSLYPNLKRLFMSGYTANVIAHHGVLDEGVYFIQKPFSVKDLAAKVRDALGS